MKPLGAWLHGLGVIGSGIADWAQMRRILRGESRWTPAPLDLPPPETLPAAERRRTGNTTRLALAAGHAALADAAARGDATDVRTLPSVFASSGGDGSNCHAICSTLASPQRLVSPTRFHNSVNNAASGYWGIATGAMAASTIVFGYDGSFAAGLLEALAWLAGSGGRILLIAYDEPYPQPLHAVRPIAGSFGLGCLLADEAPPAGGARLSVAPCGEASDTCADPALESLRLGIPAARSLPLLAAIATGTPAPQRVVLDYLDDLNLGIDVLNRPQDGRESAP